MRILGFDYGDRRIGVAISDPTGLIASGLQTIKWDAKLTFPLKVIKQILQTYDIKTIVIGLPKNMNGTLGIRGELTKKFGEILRKEFENIEIVYWDERLTTVVACKTMNDAGVKKHKKKDLVDKIAAVCILQNYLDNINRNK